MNMMVIACGDTAILVDAGVMFPEPELLGVDLIIPDLRPLLQRYRIAGAGADARARGSHRRGAARAAGTSKGPIYGTALTLALVEPKLRGGTAPRSRGCPRSSPRDRVTVGRSRSSSCASRTACRTASRVAIETPHGVVVHTGDFKIDQTPLDGERVDFHASRSSAPRACWCCSADSTNIDRQGGSAARSWTSSTPSRRSSRAREGKIVVAMFASSIYRMQILVDLAAQFDRQVAFVGRGVIDNSEIAQRLGYLRIPAGVQIRDSEVRSYPSQDVVCICTGSQGEPQAALPRIAIDDHRHVKLDHDDVVVFSAREIPGQREGDRPGDEPHRRARRRGHLRGHQARARVRPRQRGRAETDAVAGQAALLRADTRGVPPARPSRADCAARVSPGTKPVLAENGDLIRFDARGGRIAEQGAGRPHPDRRHAERRGRRRGPARSPPPRRRRAGRAGRRDQPAVRHARGNPGRDHARVRGGCAHRGAVEGNPALVAAAIEAASVEERTDPGLIKEKIRVDLQRFFRKRSGLRPLVLPVVMEI